MKFDFHKLPAHKTAIFVVGLLLFIAGSGFLALLGALMMLLAALMMWGVFR